MAGRQNGKKRHDILNGFHATGHGDGEICNHENLAAMVLDVAEERRLAMVSALAALFRHADGLASSHARATTATPLIRSLARIRTLCNGKAS